MTTNSGSETTQLLKRPYDKCEFHDKHSIRIGKVYIASLVSAALFFLLLIFYLTVPRNSNLQVLSSLDPPIKQMSHTMSPSALWGVVTKPFPTGAFWTNLVVENGDGAVNTIPYGVKCLETGIHVSYGPTRRSVTNKWIRDTFDTDIQISTVEPYQSRSISAHDDLSVTMTFLAASGSYDAVLVKGSPFLTVSFGGCTPLLQSATMHVTSFESHPLPDDSKRRYYVITLGNYQKWLVYTSFDTLLNWKSGDDEVTAAAKVTGVIRMALLPQLDYTPDLNTLLQYASCYPTGASVVLAHPKSMMSTVTYRFRTEGSGGLLMLALPHHVDVLDMSMRDSGASRAAQKTLKHIWTMKGKVLPVVGKEWLLKYDDLKDAQWVFDLEGRVISTDRLNTIAASLQTDVYSSPPSARDPYTFGKEAARMSSLALIADNLGIADARKTALNSLETSMTPWLTGANPDELVYDTTWGGIVPTRGMQDKLADYGAGWYNDHHFHFGYFIYAGAVLAKLDWAYFATHRYLFDALVADICNERGSSTSAYPFARHKDFFDGHSWASGLFQQANGKSQESSSEAVNAYHACFLYGSITEDSSLVKFSRLLMAMEVRSARKYWHAPDSYVYDEVVAQSSRMIGNVGAFDVTTSTWFGSNVEYVHGINIVPIIPPTAELFDASFVRREWEVIRTVIPPLQPVFAVHKECSLNPACSSLGILGECCPTADGVVLSCCEGSSEDASSRFIKSEWAALLYAIHAVLDPDMAWREMMSLKYYGPGNSRTNCLYWVASRPVPSLGNHSHGNDKKDKNTKLDDTGKDKSSGDSRSNSSSLYLMGALSEECVDNSACDATGMVGKCCPTGEGVRLGCCPTFVPPSAKN